MQNHRKATPRAIRRLSTLPWQDAVDFPANPFVALADFLLVLVLILALGYVALKVGDENLQQRLAVEQLQDRVEVALDDALGPYSGARSAYKLFQIEQNDRVYGTLVGRIDRVGDLLRIGFVPIDPRSRVPNTPLFFGKNQEKITNPTAITILDKIAKVLSEKQGKPNVSGTGYFKRIIVEGHTDVTEGNRDRQTRWDISLHRAQDVAQYLLKNTALRAENIEISGRGWGYPLKNHNRQNANVLFQENCRVDIIIVFAPDGASDFLENSVKQSGRDKGEATQR